MSESLSRPALPTFSWIGHLKEDDRELLSSYGEFFPGHPGSVIIQQGTVQTEVFVVISGELEVHGERPDGTRIFRARVGPGETLGEISLFDPGPATATVTASEFSQLWRIADEDLIQFMNENRGAGLVLLRTLATILAQRLRRVDPEAFGLSAYAVVDSPELEIKPELDAEKEEPQFPAIPTASPTPDIAAASPIPVSSLTPVRTNPVPIAAPISIEKPASVTPQRPIETTADQAEKEAKTNKKTQSFTNPDEEELEPL